VDFVGVEVPEDPDRPVLLVALALVNPDAQQRRSPAKGVVDALLDLGLVADGGFERPQQATSPAVLASPQIEALGALLAREDVDVVGRDAGLLERSHGRLDLALGVEERGDPPGEREQLAARVGIEVDSGHGSPSAPGTSSSMDGLVHLIHQVRPRRPGLY